MATTIKLKNSVTTTNAPSSLVQGEVAINITDKKVWVGDAATTPIQLLGAGGSASFGALTCTSLTNSGLTATRVTYATTGGLLTDSANLTFNGTTLTAGGLTTTGATSTGTLTASGVATFSAGTVSAPAITTSGDTNTGIYFPAADTIAFTEGGVEAMRIDSSGNIGIGTSSPSNPLTVRTSGTSTSAGGNIAARIESNGSGYAATLQFSDNVANSSYISMVASQTIFGQAGTERMRIDSSGNVGIGTSSPATKLDVNGNIALPNATALQFKDSGGTRKDVLQLNSSSNIILQSPSASIFQINGSAEAMRITSGGNLLIGTSSGYGNRRLEVWGGVDNNYQSTFTNTLTSGAPFGIQVYFETLVPNNTTSKFISCSDSTAVRFEVRSNGGVANYSANDVNLSDAREKTNIELSSSYLNKICAIPVKTFNYIDQNLEEDDGLTLGVIAQDVQAVAPELVMESNWGTEDNPKMRLSIYQTDLQYALMKSIQELKAIVDAQAAEIALLKSK